LNLSQKFNKLKNILSKMENAIVAYSGGVDSTLLLKVAGEVMGENVLAITASSPTYPQKEIKAARDMARNLGIRHITITTDELSNPEFFSNPLNRCYFCKKELFSRLKEIAEKNRIRFILDGSNYDDRKDFRPGDRAKQEFGIRSPLAEAGLTKKDIRVLSKKMGLPTWDKPSLACLASRFPYGSSLNRAELKMVNKAEEYLHALGFRQVRVRHYGNTARIEVEKSKIPLLVNHSSMVVRKLKRLGYTYITVDLEGYRTGSMNEVLQRCHSRH